MTELPTAGQKSGSGRGWHKSQGQNWSSGLKSRGRGQAVSHIFSQKYQQLVEIYRHSATGKSIPCLRWLIRVPHVTSYLENKYAKFQLNLFECCVKRKRTPYFARMNPESATENRWHVWDARAPRMQTTWAPMTLMPVSKESLMMIADGRWEPTRNDARASMRQSPWRFFSLAVTVPSSEGSNRVLISPCRVGGPSGTETLNLTRRMDVIAVPWISDHFTLLCLTMGSRSRGFAVAKTFLASFFVAKELALDPLVQVLRRVKRDAEKNEWSGKRGSWMTPI